MGRADYLSLGDWNASCFQCGRKRKASTMKKHWQGYYVCPEHWEPRHPQDFVRGVKENPSVPWSQPAQIQFVYPTNSTSAIAGIAISGLAIAGTGGNLNPPGTTNFIDGQTLIQSSWLNDVNDVVFVTVPAIALSVVDVSSRLNAIESDGWVTDARVSNISFSKLSNKPTTLAGYGITGGGTLIGMRVFTTADSGSVYSPTPGTNKVIVEIVGGGGPGGSSGATGGSIGIGSGGASGTYAIGFYTAGFDGVTLTIGGGGVANNSGGSPTEGGISSFGTLLECPGGTVGETRYQGNTSHDIHSSIGKLLTLPADATGSKILSVPGYPGQYGWGSIASGSVGGKGADSKYGRGGVPSSVSSATAGDGLGYGSGGGSGWAVNGTGGWLAGNGAPGVIVVWEYV